MKTFLLVVKILVPITFFTIAALEGKGYWLAGIMTIVVIGSYAYEYLEKLNK